MPSARQVQTRGGPDRPKALARAGADELGVAQDAVRGAFTDGQGKHVHQPAGAEAGRFFPRGEDEFLACWGNEE